MGSILLFLLGVPIPIMPLGSPLDPPEDEYCWNLWAQNFLQRKWSEDDPPNAISPRRTDFTQTRPIYVVRPT
jgi:hypothetical protein